MEKREEEITDASVNTEPVGMQDTAIITDEVQEITEITDVIINDRFPIVGIGASAGGLAAFESFFSGMPADTDPDMAFVLVQHLAPDHKSILTDLIRRYTRMQVFEVENGMKVYPNCAYIIPPNRNMAFLNGTLQLLEPSAPRGQRLPIDFFFRSLANDQHERAICIVLSGTGSDGTLGVRAIKGEGGMAMAQEPDSTEYDGMPRNAIATGLIDYELSPAEMPAQLITYVAHAFSKQTSNITIAPAPKSENVLHKIFTLLRTQTGHDFSQYKPRTINRRIERRMAIHQIEITDDYLKLLQQSPAEVEALFRDLLIGVTNFFRDPTAFDVFEKLLIPKLVANKPDNAIIRVWIPGCSTGEEAYSIAILLTEVQELLKKNFRIQIFATDIDSKAIATARAGYYPASIIADISQERIARFFIAEPNGETYHIRKSIRDMLVFSEQDVIKDPPFSKLDLISCRNLLIYMDSLLQKKIIPLFHYSLNPGGFLFLGTSESVGEFADLFDTLDRKAKLYRSKSDFYSVRRASLGKFLSPMFTLATSADKKHTDDSKLPLREITERTLLQRIVQVAALVNANGDILYLHGRTGMFLEVPSGVSSGVSNILKMAREGLQYELTVALRKVVLHGTSVYYPGLRVKTNGDFSLVNLSVHLVTESSADAPFFLVLLEQQMTPFVVTSTDTSNVDARISELMIQMRTKEEYIQTANEELETANEELKSSNEEMQSINEELQSTNEELETSKEELQSVNEELLIVNSELITKVTDLSRANNDITNLLAGSGIGILFVDIAQRITRFTPAITKIINLISSDAGRPVHHILSNLIDYNNLSADIQSVLDSLIPKEIEVRIKTEEWFIMRILPYRTMDNVIEGAVVTFIDITEKKLAEKEISRQLSEKGILLKEVHHRIKNNIQSIGGLLSIQLDSSTNSEVIAGLRDALGRVNSMRILYDKLLLTDEYGNISAKNYIESLIDAIITLFKYGRVIIIDKQLDDFYLDTKRLFSLGIIVNEIFTNILKYAFPDNNDGLIKVTLIKINNTVTLTIQDDGRGLPDGFDLNESKEFGLMLVKMLCEQIHGVFTIKTCNGTRVILIFNI